MSTMPRPVSEIESDICRTALLHDTTSFVGVFDEDGRIHFANRQMAVLLGGPDTVSVVGRHLSEFFGHDFVHERIELIRRAILTQRPVTVIGMIRASWNRTIFRPLASQVGLPARVLAVSHPAPETQPPLPPGAEPDADVINARFHDKGRLGRLTARELQVLRLIGEGLSTDTIAARLGRSAKTVEWHRVALGEKLGVTNRVELARIAIAAGLSNLS